MEDSSEKVLKVFVALQRRGVEVGALDFLGKPEAFAALPEELFLVGSFVVALKLEGVLMNEEVEEEDAGCPNVYFYSVAIF